MSLYLLLNQPIHPLPLAIPPMLALLLNGWPTITYTVQLRMNHPRTITILTPMSNANGDTINLAIKDEVMMAHVCHYIMTHTANKIFLNTQPAQKQFGLKKGLQFFGSKGESTVRKELTQFHTLKCFALMDTQSLTHDDRRNALTSLMLGCEFRVEFRRIPENSGEFLIPDPFLSQFFPIPVPVPIGLRVLAKF
jgi:hypothetical protein